ncbi:MULTISPECIES: tetratricopeptide repeat protein [unclassified Herbaspirillum]|uniref:tetratricopeptide repeat protein n=1 Tax=unclassified Herbaspirillum TaxID=2624150 RepID=UPI0009DA24DB|nr:MULTISPECIES: tetratricopeptide repeat protein [unclassified Herbaspirillum]MCI1006682.1 tetratricopeptide repeat protein [Herbaspirillum sp. C7C8]
MPAPSPSPDQLLAGALQHYNAGHFAQAEQASHAVLALAPQHPAAHQLLAMLALNRQALAQARQHILLSLAPRPQHVPSLLIAGRIALANADPEGAVACFEAAAHHQPDLSQAHFHLGTSLSALGRHAQAATALRQAVALAPQAMEAVLNLGSALRELGDLAAARTAFTQACRLRADLAEPWFNLGLTLQDLQETAAAVEAFARALQLRPDYADAALNLGVALQEVHRMDEALQAFRTALRLQPQWFGRIAHALTAGTSGRLWLHMRDLEAALRA